MTVHTITGQTGGCLTEVCTRRDRGTLCELPSRSGGCRSCSGQEPCGWLLTSKKFRPGSNRAAPVSIFPSELNLQTFLCSSSTAPRLADFTRAARAAAVLRAWPPQAGAELCKEGFHPRRTTQQTESNPSCPFLRVSTWGTNNHPCLFVARAAPFWPTLGEVTSTGTGRITRT